MLPVRIAPGCRATRHEGDQHEASVHRGEGGIAPQGSDGAMNLGHRLSQKTNLK